MENFYVMQDQLLNNSFDELQMIYKQHKKTESMISSFIGVRNIGLQYFKTFYKSTSNLSYHPILPLIIKWKGENVFLKDIEKRFGKQSQVYKELVENFEHNNNIIKNYKWLKDIEITNIYIKY